MRPILSTSVTSPVDMKVAQTSTAAEANSGDESAANAGVRAELIWAWYCSSNKASWKSGSGNAPKILIVLVSRSYNDFGGSLLVFGRSTGDL